MSYFWAGALSNEQSACELFFGEGLELYYGAAVFGFRDGLDSMVLSLV